MNLQSSMDQAVVNYLSLSNELRTDAEMLLEVNESGLINESDIRWQRNFVRTLVPIIEGCSHSIRQMEKVGLECGAQELSQKEQKVTKSPEDFDIKERIKYTLSGSFKIFQLCPYPNFGTTDWRNAKVGLDWRNDLMHPKTPSDLEITSASWPRIKSGLIWLYKQHCAFIEQLYNKYK